MHVIMATPNQYTMRCEIINARHLGVGVLDIYYTWTAVLTLIIQQLGTLNTKLLFPLCGV